MAILIDAEQLSKHKYVGVEYNGIEMGIPASAVNVLAYKWGWNDALDSVKRFAPTVDAEPVVRCKDCSRCATVKSFGKEYLYCDAFYDHADGDLIGVSLMVEPDHYCSWGERREER